MDLRSYESYLDELDVEEWNPNSATSSTATGSAPSCSRQPLEGRLFGDAFVVSQRHYNRSDGYETEGWIEWCEGPLVAHYLAELVALSVKIHLID